MLSRRRAAIGLAVAATVLIAAPAASGQGRERLEMYTLTGSPDAIREPPAASSSPASARSTIGDQGRRGADAGAAREGRRERRAGQAEAQHEGTDGHRAGAPPGGRRLQRLALLGRAGRHPGRAVRHRERQPADRQARGPRARRIRVASSSPSRSPQGARDKRDGSRPAVLYSSNQHAREWISAEVNRRLLHHFIDGWRAKDKEIRDLLKRTELWFVVVANPDGYQYTFDHERLWRKNLRDNDGNGQITIGDGVDPNRNFREHWGYDNEGSSPDPADETYRGPSAASEPETRAMQGLIDRVRPKIPVEHPLLRAVAAVPAGLAGRHARRRQPALRGARRDRRRPGDPGLQPRPVGGHAVRHQRRDDRLLREQRGHRSRTRRSSGRGCRERGSCSPTTRR